MLSSSLPLFPLPNVVLFPGVFLPLHVFEPRYREMVKDALAEDRIIGMALLKPGWEHEYEGVPPVFPVGCAGVITHVEQLPDGRYNLVLRGIEKFRITSEEPGRPYRIARVEYVDERMTRGRHDEVRRLRHRLEELLGTISHTTDPQVPANLSDEELVNALAQYLDLEPVERQALLERDGVAERGQALVDLLEMKTMTPLVPPGKGLVH